MTTLHLIGYSICLIILIVFIRAEYKRNREKNRKNLENKTKVTKFLSEKDRDKKNALYQQYIQDKSQKNKDSSGTITGDIF